ncbi:hypothetical protein CR513_13822, partial [Mucuna pruriens]
MEEIRTRTKKHIEVEEDQADRIKVEKEAGGEVRQKPKGENKYPTRQRDYLPSVDPAAREEGTDTSRNSPHQHAQVPEGHEGPMDGTKHAGMVRVSPGMQPFNEGLSHPTGTNREVDTRGAPKPICPKGD